MTMPRPEHPRPIFVRTPWQNLNGTWHFQFDPESVGEQMRWERTGHVSRAGSTIQVPYPWESALSGQGRTDYKGAGWYERDITIPADWQGLDPILHFGAIDWEARVWINGQLVAEHRNGYLPFACNLRDHVAPGESARLTVRAYDSADAETLVGKQVPRWYTYSSGIWQTVWLEARPADWIEHIRFGPDIAGERATASVRVRTTRRGPWTLEIASPDQQFAPAVTVRDLDPGTHTVEMEIPVPAPHLWSPDHPFLYDALVRLCPDDDARPDEVATYFGMREFGRAVRGDNAQEYLLLNHEPVYLRGALDQAFHPDGLYTYPTDDDIRRDIALAKAYGLNMLRCHIKINDPRYYYWADRLGLLIHYDMPSPDLDSPAMRAVCADTIRRMIERDGNHPSIMLWILFNETWGLTQLDTQEGQEWLRQMVHLARELDPTRLVEDNSPCNYDHVETDVNSWHFYINDYAKARSHIQRVVDNTYPGSAFNYIGEGNVQGREALMNSEYGGISAAMGDMDISWCFKFLTSDLRRHAAICGYVYTELTDIEWEHNGFVKYDRSRKFYGYEDFVAGMTVADLNAPLFVGLDCPPCQTLVPGATFRAPLFVSNWGPELDAARVNWEAVLVDTEGETSGITAGTIDVTPERFGVVTGPEVVFPVGAVSGVATVALRLTNAAGEILHRNYVNLEITAGPAPRLEKRADATWVRFQPDTFRACTWPIPEQSPAGSKVAGAGPGTLDYVIDMPATVDPAKLSCIEFRCELGSRADRMEKLSWPPRNWRQHTPQTMERQFPSRVEVSLNGIQAGILELADDPADARGVLSHYHGHEPGSYGYLCRLRIEGEALQQLSLDAGTGQLALRLDSASAGSGRGFSVYGEEAGAYPLDPTLIFFMNP